MVGPVIPVAGPSSAAAVASEAACDGGLGGLADAQYPVPCAGLGQRAVRSSVGRAEVSPSHEKATERVPGRQYNWVTGVIGKRRVLQAAPDPDEFARIDER